MCIRDRSGCGCYCQALLIIRLALRLLFLFMYARAARTAAGTRSGDNLFASIAASCFSIEASSGDVLVVSFVGWMTGVSAIDGVVGSIPPAVHAFSMDFSLIATAGFIGVAFAFLFVDFFDTAGTLTSVANLTGKVDQDGNVEGIGKAVLADSAATTVGALVGTSNTTSYIESGAGIKEGGRTGLTAVTVAILFAICLFLAPLAQSIPAFATAPALVFVATFFLKNLRDIEWDDVSEYAPAVLAAVLMPLTFSIAHGIALGFIAYVVIKALSGRHEDLNAGSIVIGALSVLYFIF